MSRREKLYYHLLDPERLPLDDREQTNLDRCKTAFAIMTEELSQRNVIKKLMEIDPTLNNFTAAKIIEDVHDVFSPMLKRNRDFDKAVLIERFLKLYDKMESEEEWEIQRLCLVSIERLTGAAIQQEVGAINPEDIVLPQLIITSDPNALFSQDIEHEEV